MSDTSGGNTTQSDVEALNLILGQQSPNDEALIELAREEIYHAAYYELCEAVTGKAPDGDPPDEETFKQQVLDFLNSRRDEFHERICVKLKWCQRRKEFGTSMVPIPWFLYVIGFLVDAKSFGLAGFTWGMTTDLFDKFCKCNVVKEEA